MKLMGDSYDSQTEADEDREQQRRSSPP